MHNDYGNDAPVFLLTISGDMAIQTMNGTATAMFGAHKFDSVATVVDSKSLHELSELMRVLAVGAPAAYHTLNLRLKNGERAAVLALVDKLQPRGEPDLRITGLYSVDSQAWLEDMIHSGELHRAFVQTSSEAMWCIDFSEPIDLALGNHEIIRQVFENECRWLMCNEAMARLYNVPKGMDFNRQPVSLYFPRNPGNEMFIRQIIESDYAVDKALSIDTSHDGSLMYMENSVQCKIINNHLLRMWGTVRDVTRYREAQNRLAREAQDVRSVLNAIPDAILVIDRERRLLAVNSSFEALLGWSPEKLLGCDVQAIIDLETPLPNGRCWYGIDRQHWIAQVKVPTGSSIKCDAQSFPMGDEAPDQFILTLHPAPD